jgi:chromosome segregation protein
LKESFDHELERFKSLELSEVNLKLQNALNESASKENDLLAKDNEILSIKSENKELKQESDSLKLQLAASQSDYDDANLKLSDALTAVDEKNAEIKELNDLVVSQKETILDLKNNIVNKDNLVALQREIDSKNVTIREKDFEIKMLKDKSVSREEFSRIQDELDKKEEQIQRLNEVKDLFFEISGTEAIASEIKGSPEEKLNPTSLDNKSLDELNEIKRELELAKENKIRFKVVEDTDDEDDDGIINVEASSKDDELKEKDEALESMKADNAELNKELTDLKAEIEALKNNTEVDDLRAEINEYKDSMEEFEKIKDLYEKLTAPQLKNLNSIQSQIYQLLPDEEMDTLAVKNYINEVAFKNVSFGNIKNILKSLERKGYVEVTKTEDNVSYWKKIEVEN